MIGDPVFQEWFPLGTSIDLIKGTPNAVASAVATEIRRFIGREPLVESEVLFPNLTTMFASVELFANVPTIFFCIPTKTNWTALWTNCFLFAGYDSLCHCLTKNHALTTIHWSAADAGGIFQPGSSFCHRTLEPGGDIVKRTVHCSQQDSRWEFHTEGVPLSEEDVTYYDNRIKKLRFNESILIALLSRLGAEPRLESFYDFSQAVRTIVRTNFPDTIATEDFGYIKTRANSKNQDGEQEGAGQPPTRREFE